MPYKNYIYEYYAKISSGEIIVGKWIKKIFEIIINGLQTQEYFFNAKAANKAIKFIETFCHHSKGRNDLITLELWQKAIVSTIFGIQDAEKIRVFREIFIVIGRKNGKSLFASALIAYMAYLEPEYGQEIYCLAPKLDQAALVYDGFYQMVQAEEELEELAKKRRSDIYIAESNTVIKPIAFNAKKSDGFNPQLVVCDEMAAWSGDAGLKQYEVMKSALGARKQPMILSISTAGYINDSIYIKQCCHLWLKSYLTIKTGSGLQQSIWKAKSTTLRKSWHTLTITAILSIRLRITQIKNAVLSGRRQRGRGAL